MGGVAHGRWLLVAYDLGRADWRTFRVDRVTEPRPPRRRFTPRQLPAPDAAAYVARSVRSAPYRYSVEATVQAPAEAIVAVEQASDLAEGISRVLNLYAELGFQSFNMALVGGHPESQDGYLCLQLVCRSHPQPHYRSDVTYWKRLHRQAMVDYRPERLAELVRPRFGT